MVKPSNHKLTWLGGIGIGAALMYFLDPTRGARRRHLLKDQATSAARSGREQLRKAAGNAKNHALGLVHELRGRVAELATGDGVLDDVLVARVRAALGHHVRNAAAVEVAVLGRTAILRGRVDGDQVENAVRSVGKVRGVWRVENQLAPTGAPPNA